MIRKDSLTHCVPFHLLLKLLLPLLSGQPHVASGNPTGHSTLQQEVKQGPLNLGR